MTEDQRAPVARAVCLTDHGGIALLTLDSAASRNALSVSLLDQLAEAVGLAALGDARAVVIAATGDVFCAGGDLGGVLEALENGAADGIERLVDQLHDVISAIRALPVPTVAAVDGAAVGAGISLAMAADVRVIGPQAVFVPGYLQVGASPDGGASYHLARALGATQALSAFLLNRKLAAAELHTRGVADLCVDSDQVLGMAIETADRLSRLSRPALAAARSLAESASGPTFAEQLKNEKKHFLAVSRSTEFRAAMRGFASAAERRR